MLLCFISNVEEVFRLRWKEKEILRSHLYLYANELLVHHDAQILTRELMSARCEEFKTVFVPVLNATLLSRLWDENGRMKRRRKKSSPLKIADINMPHRKEHNVNIYSFFCWQSHREREEQQEPHKRSQIKAGCWGYQTKTGNQYVITASYNMTHTTQFSMCMCVCICLTFNACHYSVFWLNLGSSCLFFYFMLHNP